MMSIDSIPANQTKAFQTRLLSWWNPADRSLPWRDTRDPWAILVSEVMAQQTQVERVIPRWHEFMERFPSPADAASAPLSAILGVWSGLGYNSRGKRLHEAAQAIMNDHHGSVPDNLSDLLKLPGVGPYTARAVLAFAFTHDVAVVDTNVGRVLARWIGQSLGSKDAQASADRLVPAGFGWTWNQALLDLGAQVCRKRDPQCVRCPLQRTCAFGTNPAQADPAEGSFAVTTKQSAFEGSDRQGRGKLIKLLLDQSVARTTLPTAMGWPQDETRAERVVRSLIKEGLVDFDGSHYRLPAPDSE